MKGFIITLLIGVSLAGYSQRTFNEFLNDLPTYNYPLDYSFINAKKVTINRNICLKYWILPITCINRNKPDKIVSFEFDTTVINMYRQWDKKNWNKKEPVYMYLPVMTGEFYCVGKSNISNNLVGIIWYFFQLDVTYGHGAYYWLGTYSLSGKLIDYVKIYENTSSMLPIEHYKFERKFKIYNNNKIVFWDKNINDKFELDSLRNEKTWIDTTFTRHTYILRSDGKFEKKE